MSDNTAHGPQALPDPAWLRPLNLLSSGLNAAAAVIAATLLCAMTLLILVEIALRFFGTSTFMSDALVSYGVAAITFLAAPWALQHGAMIRVRILIDRVTGPARWIAEAFTLLTTGWILWFLLSYEWRSMMKLMARGSVSQDYHPIPLWIPEAFFSAGLALLLLQVVIRGLRLIALAQTDDRGVTL